MIPFTPEVFLSLFEQYNGEIWPAQIVAYALGLLVIAAMVLPVPGSDRAASAVLAGFWLWNGAVYHLDYFASINFSAYAFGVLFIIQALLLIWTGVLRGKLAFRLRTDASGWCGIAFVVIALLVYPLTAHALGHGWPQAALFGVAPCPTAIFTLGVLLLAHDRTPWHLMVIPVLWALIGGTAPFLLGIVEDLFLVAAGLIGAVMAALRNRGLAPREAG